MSSEDQKPAEDGVQRSRGDKHKMVHLHRIYTRTGDDGTTGLGDGSRVEKQHPRVAAYGTVDELSALLGVCRAHGLEERYEEWLRAVQNDLFDLGSDLCTPGGAEAGKRLPEGYALRLEGWIDECRAELAPLTSFILPGGERQAAWMHLARTVCRRAERDVCAFAEGEDDELNPNIGRYLNRLSDFLFVLARLLNDGGKKDILWVPGAGAGED